MTELSIRIDDELNTRAEQVFASAGITMATAVSLFLNQVVARRKIPFSLPKKPTPAGLQGNEPRIAGRSLDQDPVYNPAMMRHIKKSIEQMKQGRYVVKTMEELRRMEDE